MEPVRRLIALTKGEAETGDPKVGGATSGLDHRQHAQPCGFHCCIDGCRRTIGKAARYAGTKRRWSRNRRAASETAGVAGSAMVKNRRGRSRGQGIGPPMGGLGAGRRGVPRRSRQSWQPTGAGTETGSPSHDGKLPRHGFDWLESGSTGTCPKRTGCRQNNGSWRQRGAGWIRSPSRLPPPLPAAPRPGGQVGERQPQAFSCKFARSRSCCRTLRRALVQLVRIG